MQVASARQCSVSSHRWQLDHLRRRLADRPSASLSVCGLICSLIDVAEAGPVSEILCIALPCRLRHGAHAGADGRRAGRGRRWTATSDADWPTDERQPSSPAQPSPAQPAAPPIRPATRTRASLQDVDEHSMGAVTDEWALQPASRCRPIRSGRSLLASLPPSSAAVSVSHALLTCAPPRMCCRL